MTILLTVLGVCIVALLVWLCVSSYKLMKFRKKAEGALKHLERWIDDNHVLAFKEMEAINDGVQNDLTGVREKIDHMVNDLYKTCNDNQADNQREFDEVTRLSQNLRTNVYHDMDIQVANLNSKFDSRCDKLYDDFHNRVGRAMTEVARLEKEDCILY